MNFMLITPYWYSENSEVLVQNCPALISQCNWSLPVLQVFSKIVLLGIISKLACLVSLFYTSLFICTLHACLCEQELISLSAVWGGDTPLLDVFSREVLRTLNLFEKVMTYTYNIQRANSSSIFWFQILPSYTLH